MRLPILGCLPVTLVLALAGCALDPFETAPYRPPGPPLAAEGPAVIAVAPVVDARVVGAPVTGDPAAARTAAALRRSLAARSLLADGTPRLTLHARLLTLGAVRRPQETAQAALALTLENRQGRTVYTDTVDVAHTEGAVFELDTGPDATPLDVRDFEGRVLAEAVDRAIDKLAFRRAVAATQAGWLERLVTVQ